MLKDKATNEKQVEQYIRTVRKSLKEKYGKVDPAWELMVDMLQDNLLLYYSYRDRLRSGEELKFSESKSFREITATILKLSQKLGVSSPYDYSKVKPPKKETKEEPDYIDSL